MEKEVQQSLTKVQQSLQQQPVTQHYQQMKKIIANRQDLAQLLVTIEDEQKEVIKLGHYDKPQAAKWMNQQVDQHHQDLNEDIDVQSYRESLYEANDLLHYVTERIETAVNKYYQQTRECNNGQKKATNPNDETISGD